MSEAFDGCWSSVNNSGAIHRIVPPRVGAVTEMLIEELRNTLVSPKSTMRAEKLLPTKMLLFTPIVSWDRTVKESNVRSSDLREQTASHVGTSVHGRHLLAGEVGSG